MLIPSSAAMMVGLDLLMIVYTLWVFSLGGNARRWVPIAGAMALLWLCVLHVLLSQRLLFRQDISGVWFLVAIFAGVGMFGIVLFANSRVRTFLFSLEQRQLMLVQGIRVFFGAGFMMQAALGTLPLAFGILDGITHVGAGFFGLIAAFALASSKEGERRAWFANVFGLLDILIVASTLALVLLPEIGPHHSMMYAVFLPAPLWLWCHAISIAKLLRADIGPPTVRIDGAPGAA